MGAPWRRWGPVQGARMCQDDSREQRTVALLQGWGGIQGSWDLGRALGGDRGPWMRKWGEGAVGGSDGLTGF